MLVTYVDESVLVYLTLFGTETVICTLFFFLSFFRIPLWTCLPLKSSKCQQPQLLMLGKHGQTEMLRYMAAGIQVCERGKARRENHCRHITAGVWEKFDGNMHRDCIASWLTRHLRHKLI